VKTESITLQVLTLVLRTGLLVALLSAGWFVYVKLPHRQAANPRNSNGETTLQIVLEQSPEMRGLPLNIPVEIYPVDIVAVRHEYFTERRAGKRFEEFLNERMNGRRPITTQLDKQGQASVVITGGTWWIHAMLAGQEDLEWRLPISVGEEKQTIQLTAQNVYARSRSF
jgi:hypothetical protein